MSSVKLVSYSTGVNGESIKDLIIYCARVSNPDSQLEGLGVERLWKYLKKNKHWSPFEMAHVCMEINTTRDIARQILRHRSFSFQEFMTIIIHLMIPGNTSTFKELLIL